MERRQLTVVTFKTLMYVHKTKITWREPKRGTLTNREKTTNCSDFQNPYVCT